MNNTSWLPILCYHDVLPADYAGTPTPYATTVERFTAQMHALHERGYRAISVEEAAGYARDGQPAPPRVVVITFDDGYRSLVTHVLPVLQDLGWTATAYLVTDFVLPPAEPCAPPPGDYLDVAGVRVLQDAGWELGAHTCSHADLTAVSHERMKQEIDESRSTLATLFDAPITTFAYPYSRISVEALAQVELSGFGNACGGYTTDHSLFNLSRITADGYTPGQLIRRCSRLWWRMRTNTMLRALKQRRWSTAS